MKRIPDNSIDYVLTNPPHGDRIPYLELSMMWNSWLKKDENYEDETSMIGKSHLYAIAHRCEGIQEYDKNICEFHMIPLKIINFNHMKL